MSPKYRRTLDEEKAMGQIKKYFEIKDYEALKSEIYHDPNYRKDLQKLSYLVSAFYYTGDFKGTISAISLILPIARKAAYSMYIDTYICLGTDEMTALHYVEAFLAEPISEAEKNWAYFKMGQCHLARGGKDKAIQYFTKSDLKHNAPLDLEKHFFMNNTLDDFCRASNDGEEVNCMIIQSRKELSAKLAKDSIVRAKELKYGEGEYFASAVLAKYLNDNSEIKRMGKLQDFQNNVIYFRII